MLYFVIDFASWRVVRFVNMVIKISLAPFKFKTISLYRRTFSNFLCLFSLLVVSSFISSLTLSYYLMCR